MRISPTSLLIALQQMFASWAIAGTITNYVPATVEPPVVAREFRGVWIATVGNVDWPTTPGLPVDEQKRELLRILDCAVNLKLNAVIFQVRPMCDAMYDSKVEPWSYYLTGEMGRPPAPWYDPLRFAVDEAHKRGLELHAWFSPYRAGPPSGNFAISKNHISRTRADLVRKYGTQLWLDPGEREVRDYTVNAIMDVVNRYDIDAVTFDDRLGYPTDEDLQKRHVDFPDTATYRRYLASGGKLARDDWRRENVNTFVHRVYDRIKAAKPWVKVGIAPSGIWESGHPAQIKGQSAYSVLYTDSRKWLAEGWLDYCAPQLYWAIQQPNQSFPVLLKWWLDQNVKHRNVWPGLDSAKAGGEWQAGEISNQIAIVRDQERSSPGEAHYSAKCLVENRGGLSNALASGVYAKPALVPPSPWLETNSPAKPRITVDGGRQVNWEAEPGQKVALWLLQTRVDNQWQTRILPGPTRSFSLGSPPEEVSITAIDRCGVASPSAVLQRSVSEQNSELGRPPIAEGRQKQRK